MKYLRKYNEACDEDIASIEEVKEIFQEFADEYHISPQPSREDYINGNIPESLYYDIIKLSRLMGNKIQTYRIDVWYDSSRHTMGAIGEATIDAFDNLSKNPIKQRITDKFNSFGYKVIDYGDEGGLLNITIME